MARTHTIEAKTVASLESHYAGIGRERRQLQKTLADIARYRARGNGTMADLCERHAHRQAKTLAQRVTEFFVALLGKEGFAAWVDGLDSGVEEHAA